MTIHEAYGKQFRCADVYHEVTVAYQEAVVGQGADPIVVFKARHGSEVYDPNKEGGLYELESDIQSIFDMSPARRVREWDRIVAAMLKKYGLSREAFETVYAYYGEHIWEGDRRVVGEDFDRIRQDVEELRRTLEILRASRPENGRYFYYLSNLKHKSVASMAQELGLSQQQVYRELSLLNLSIGEAFTRHPTTRQQKLIADSLRAAGIEVEGCETLCAKPFIEIAQVLHDRGVPTEVIARYLGLRSDDGLRFFFHAEGTAPRGEQWNQVVGVPGKRLNETEALLELYGEGHGHAEIARRLNILKG
ncbi:MAG: hypothetical protein KDD39_15770, partial [Bdellovibrionales bacterium]|nr:hypothetical protein [Bdellovibrionales bacterium]